MVDTSNVSRKRGVVPWFWNCIFSPPVADRDR